jgi:hypothetical protein
MQLKNHVGKHPSLKSLFLIIPEKTRSLNFKWTLNNVGKEYDLLC